MAASLLSTIDPPGPSIYYSERFRQMLEDHLLIIRNMTTNTVITLTEDEGAILNRYVGDFYGFLTAKQIPRQYHWTVMRMNGFRSRFDLDLSLEQLILPDYVYIDKLAALCKEKR